MKIGSRSVGFRRNKFGRLILRIAKDERGMEMVEYALGIALMAAVAGFGLLFLGNAVHDWFQTAGNAFAPGAQFPSQPTGLSSTTTTTGG
jgi:Flp pilus assembly pilin Flp